MTGVDEPTATASHYSLGIVHDYLVEMGGAERVVAAMLEVLPMAALYTSVFDARAVAPVFGDRGVRTSMLQRAGGKKAVTRGLLPLLPSAVSRLDVSGHDVVLSSSSGFAHHVRTPPSALHLCYCYTPPRFLWRPDEYFYKRTYQRRGLAPVLSWLRRRDIEAAAAVDGYIAISRYVASLIESTYAREAHVLYPPVDVSRFALSGHRTGRFLVVSRLLPYKRIDLAVEAATCLGVPLDVIGSGPDEARLKRMAGPTVRFLGWQPDEAVREAMATCSALILPGAEDFGLTAVEVQASGRPPIAYAGGGALETVSEGETGFFFRQQTADSLARAMVLAQERELSSEALRSSAERFDLRLFGERLARLIESERERKARAGSGELAVSRGRRVGAR